MKFALSFSTFAVMAITASTVQGNASSSPGSVAPAGFNITSVDLSGTGCPPGSFYHVLDVNRTQVVVSFSKYWAEAGPGVPTSANERNCTLKLGVKIPTNFKFGVAAIDYVGLTTLLLVLGLTQENKRGFYKLDSQVTAAQKSIYTFQGKIVKSTARSDLVGPIEDGSEFLHRDEFDIHDSVLSPCGGNAILNIDTKIRISNAKNLKGSGYIVTDSIDNALKQVFTFDWQACKK